MNAATSAGPWPTSSGSAIVSEKSGPIVAPSSTAQRKPPPGSSTTPSSETSPSAEQPVIQARRDHIRSASHAIESPATICVAFSTASSAPALPSLQPRST